MKYAQLSAFEKHLESSAPNHFANLYLLISKESFDRKQALNKVKQHLIKEDVAIPLFDGDSEGIAALLAEVNALSLFSKRRLLHLSLPEKVTAKTLEPLQTILSHLPKDLCLVITADALSHQLNFFKLIEKIGVILEIPHTEKSWEKEGQAIQFLQTQISRSGKKMDPSTCQWMVRQVGFDQALLAQEFEKLILYVGERQDVTRADIEAICGKYPQESIWQLGEAIFRHEASNAIQIFQTLLREGQAMIALLRAIRSQCITGLQICFALQKDGGTEEVSRLFPYLKGQLLSKQISLSQGYGLSSYRSALIEIDKAEVQAKNSAFDDETIFADLLILKLCKR